MNLQRIRKFFSAVLLLISNWKRGGSGHGLSDLVMDLMISIIFEGQIFEGGSTTIANDSTYFGQKKV